MRRRENKELIKQGDHRLKGSRYMWLVNDENLAERFQEAFSALKHSDLKVARAWAIKELFRDFWDYATRGGDTGISTSGTAGQSAADWSRSRRSPECSSGT